MTTNPARFINLPAAVVAIVIRKLFDTYAGIHHSGVSNLVLPTGFRAFERYLREFVRFNGMNIYFIGAAATSVLYYLKKFKVIRIIRRSRESIACGTTNSVLRCSKIKLNRSLKMLFNRDDRFMSYMKRCSFPMSRRSHNEAAGSSTTLCHYRGRERNSTYSAPSNLLEPPRTLESRASFSGGDDFLSAPRPDTSATNAALLTPQEYHPRCKNRAMQMPLTIGLNMQVPKRTHLQDIHGNIYDCRSLPMSLQSDGKDNDTKNTASGPSRAAGGYRAYLSEDNCDGDFSRLDNSELELITPSVIREMIPSEIDVGGFRVPSKLGIPGLKVRRDRPRARPRPRPRQQQRQQQRKASPKKKPAQDSKKRKPGNRNANGTGGRKVDRRIHSAGTKSPATNRGSIVRPELRNLLARREKYKQS